jgi:hypothetical protein
MRKRIWALIAVAGVAAALFGTAAHASTTGTYVDPPTNVRATTNADGYPVVSWDASKTDADVIGEYEIFPASGPATIAGGASTGGDVTTVTITNLAPGTYTFHVRAVIKANNPAGILRSDFSAPSNEVVNAPPPPLFTPLQVHATPGDSSATVFWWMGTNLTHETNFQILVTPGNSFPSYTVLAPTTATSFTVNGLTNGVPYTFEVRGEDSSIGPPPLFSAWSVASPSVTPHAPVTTPSLSVGDVHVVRPPHKRFTITVPVHFSAATSSPVTIVWHIVPGTATAQKDYFDPGVVTTVIPAGTNLGSLSLDLRPHTAISGTRTFTVVISSASGATIADGSATVTLTRR